MDTQRAVQRAGWSVPERTLVVGVYCRALRTAGRTALAVSKASRKGCGAL